MTNPYARKALHPAHNNGIMGRQSQHRLSNTKRAFALASSSKKRKTGQSTLLGGQAFESERDCAVCKAYSISRYTPGYRIPKRSHHVLCLKNKKTKGRGAVHTHTAHCETDAKRLEKLFRAPLLTHEKGSGVHCTKEAAQAFFAPKKKSFGDAAPPSTDSTKQQSTVMVSSTVSPVEFYSSVSSTYRVLVSSWRVETRIVP